MRKLGKKQLSLLLSEPIEAIPDTLASYGLQFGADRNELIYTYDTRAERTGITALLNDMRTANISFKDLSTTQSSLEDIFVDLVREKR
jgi:ABC-2 type transport system ATP-binding protein